MLRLNLTSRIWFSFILLILVIAVSVAVIYPISIQQALKEDSFDLIQQEQLNFIPTIDHDDNTQSGLGFIEQQQAAHSVGNLIVQNGIGQLSGAAVPASVLKEMMSHANSSKKLEVGQFELNYKGATLFYVTRHIDTNDGQATVISYMWDTYRNQMAKKLWIRLLYVFLLAVIISLGFSVWLTHYLKAPLKALGKNFEAISKFNWKEPFIWNSGDEFQALADQFENMRKNLVHYDEAQKEFLQQASHELKTPIMVIQSYAQAVKDGLLPNGLDTTMDIIFGEAKQMEHRVKKLLYYTRIDSLKDETPTLELITFGELAQSFKERLSAMKPEVKFHISGESVMLHVDPEQFGIVLENLLENALRYAESKIELKAEEGQGCHIISIHNDGSSISEDIMDSLFEPFKKGVKGQFGLGLAIVKRLIERHNGTIDLFNDKDGVTFKITIPF
ncbi:HAMP domain-containing sensor histidine kinase [Pullulanibacillus sp. KACC 23026]|uniref:sensor histidine kinase n=1 Tax=Pullulanibacillus sp. KACC 23026 TaxID=3028315 RepID=UPI0023B2042D|nr:HAMP domain-containing sensor histidine kinase [Pullulanibacillus sp. KACC 23026]WEG12038.1 HAMP domain-containing sensor histidine kinase [Pullulanibacillus sp. KACC 23026]